MIEKAIPSTGERIPVIGMGTWQSFDVADGAVVVPLVETFVDGGGRVIDTSPMYGHAEAAIGEVRRRSTSGDKLWIATKVWTQGLSAGVQQMERSMKLMGTSRVDLMQIHNLVDWRVQLATLRRWKDEGRIRYIGITHYVPSAFEALASILRHEPIDFVQLPYSLSTPDAERMLLPLCAERGAGVLVNRPLEEGALLRAKRSLPDEARDLGVASWAELALRYVISHPAVTCAIPATSSLDHLRENLRAGTEPLWSEDERRAALALYHAR
jgi:diketogulonate reductase-like aldo/keto reductase